LQGHASCKNPILRQTYPVFHSQTHCYTKKWTSLNLHFLGFGGQVVKKKASVDLHANFFPTKLSATVIASQLKSAKLLASALWTWQTQSQVDPSFKSPRLLVTPFGRAR